MATYWTVAYGGNEKSFLDWGFTRPVMTPVSQAVGRFTVRVLGAAGLTVAPPIAFGEQAVIRRNRVSSDGAANSFSGGEIVFQGRQITRRIEALPGEPGYALTFGDAWYDLENTVFQQRWTYKSFGVTQSSAWFSRLNLFQNYNAGVGGLHNTGQQLAEILNYAISQCAVNLQVGTIDPACNVVIYPVRAMMCATAMLVCLEPTPDAVTWIDYATVPPTFHCRQRANLAALTLPYADGVSHVTTNITPRYDLQAQSVVLQYQKTNQEDGKIWTGFYVDAYPVGATGQAVGALVCPLDLRGAQRTDVTVVVSAAALDPTSLDWWQRKKAEVKTLRTAPNTIAIVPGSVKVIDDATQADITGTWAANYPNEQAKGDVLPWMKAGSNPIISKLVTVSAQFTYAEYDTASRKWHEVKTAAPHVFSTRVKITNSAPGDIPYSALQHFDPGETAPAGLAQAIYASLATLQYEGTHTTIEREIGTIVGPKYVLNLTGGAAAWASMGANIQSVTIDFFKGRTEITLGTARHLAPGDLNRLLQAFRFRQVIDNPNLQLSGSQSNQSTALGGDTAVENTTHATPAPALQTIAADAGSGNTAWLQSDATNKQLVLNVVTAAGAQVASEGSVKLALADCGGKHITVQELGVCDPETGAHGKIRVPRSDVY